MSSTTRPLAALRALIDAVDRDVLQLLSRRMALVGEVASFKRENAVRIRDLEREREVLLERRTHAERLGLPIGSIESVYRLVLLASRDYQAALRVEVPKHVEPKTVAIVGGHGGMGRRMAELFADLGHAVMIADLETRLTPVEAAAAADVVVISVPIESTAEVIRNIGPHVRDDALLLDVTSVKEEPLREMMAHCTASVLGTHPMFGPGVHTFTGQRMVLCRGRGDAWYDWAYRTFRARGLTITEADPEEHDRAMAVVQVLNHFHTQVLGLTLDRLDVDVDRTLDFTSPAYLLEMYVTARHFAQSPDLYGSIEMRNPRTAEVTEAFVEAAKELKELLDEKDRPKFRKRFLDVRRRFGDFTEEALEQSRFLIDRLVELTAGRASAPRGG
ncbi:MAG: bifunctional chorismate mutase/prephenate dehydrogenase [Myxococcota bacterium]